MRGLLAMRVGEKQLGGAEWLLCGSETELEKKYREIK